jgi:Aminoglycoside-2''''-adenylyltransferase.
MNAAHIRLVHRILDAAGHRDLPLWLGGGWAIDARLGRVTREHEDIDLTFPGERRDEFEALLASLGGRVTEEMDYGFLADVDGALLDCEPAQWNGRAYELEGVPEGSCPDAAEGVLGGRAVRCNSWDAILWDYFHYAAEVGRRRTGRTGMSPRTGLRARRSAWRRSRPCVPRSRGSIRSADSPGVTR